MRPNPSSQESEAAIQVPSQPGQANSETLSPNKTRQSKNAEKQKAIPGSLRDGEREKTTGINTRYGKRGHLKGKWYLIIMVTNAHIVLALCQALQKHLIPIPTLGCGHNKERRHAAIKQLSQYSKAEAFNCSTLPSMCVAKCACEQEKGRKREDTQRRASESMCTGEGRLSPLSDFTD